MSSKYPEPDPATAEEVKRMTTLQADCFALVGVAGLACSAVASLLISANLILDTVAIIIACLLWVASAPCIFLKIARSYKGIREYEINYADTRSPHKGEDYERFSTKVAGWKTIGGLASATAVVATQITPLGVVDWLLLAIQASLLLLAFSCGQYGLGVRTNFGHEAPYREVTILWTAMATIPAALYLVINL